MSLNKCSIYNQECTWLKHYNKIKNGRIGLSLTCFPYIINIKKLLWVKLIKNKSLLSVIVLLDNGKLVAAYLT